MLIEHKTGLEATIKVLETGRNDLAVQFEAQTITDEQVTTITEFAQEVACGLEEADRNLESRQQMIELLDVKATLALEDGKKVAYVRCVVGNDALSIVPTFTFALQQVKISTTHRRFHSLDQNCTPIDDPMQHDGGAGIRSSSEAL